MSPRFEPPKCPRCGSSALALCGESTQYGPPEWPDQPLQARALHTLAYQCKCGMGFTRTISGRQRPDSPASS